MAMLADLCFTQECWTCEAVAIRGQCTSSYSYLYDVLLPRPPILQQLSVAGRQLDSRVGVHNRVINKLCVTNSTYYLNLEETYVQGKRIIERGVSVRTQRAVNLSCWQQCCGNSSICCLVLAWRPHVTCPLIFPVDGGSLF
jgi:hypothetical protein